MATWDVTDLQRDVDDVLEHVQTLIEDIRDVELVPENIHELLQLREEIATELRDISAYYELKFSEDTGDHDVLATKSRLDQATTDVANELLFFKHWFLDLSEEAVEECKERAPRYAYYLDQLRKDAPYTLSEEIEEVINVKATTGGDAFSELYEVITNQYTFTFHGEEVTKDELLQHIRSDDPAVRRDAYETLLEKYRDNATVLTEVYKNIALDWDNEGVEIRGHDSPIAVRNHVNDVSDDAVEAVLSTVEDNVDVFTEYFTAKHAFLNEEGQDYPHSRYHIYAPYTVGKDYSYDTCKEYVLDTFKTFDERFYKAAKAVFDDDHVHSHPQQGKRGGAFNLSPHTETNPYVLLNHTGELRDLFSMAHELGHAVHGVLARDQPDLVYDPSLPLAEMASVFAEMLVAQRLLDEGSEEEQLGTLLYVLDKQYGSVARQAYFTRFEQVAHERIGAGATVADLNEAWMSTLEDQFGTMDIPDVFKHEWHYIPHFHHSPFYCYAYSWGTLLVLSLYRRFEKDGDAFIDDYIDVLKQGGSAAPRDLLGEFDIDPSRKGFWQDGFDVIRDELERFEELM